MMIRSLTGSVTATDGSSIVLTTPSGVGYLVTIPSRLPITLFDEITLHTHLAVRETALDLYGFLDRLDLTLFELLLTISGVGPKSALQIMEQADRSTIIAGIQQEDPSYLTKFSGISKKTAEKMVLTLKGKVDHLAGSNTPATLNENRSYQDAFDTLLTLGYQPAQVRQTLDSLTHLTTTSQLVAEALRLL